MSLNGSSERWKKFKGDFCGKGKRRLTEGDVWWHGLKSPGHTKLGSHVLGFTDAMAMVQENKDR
ncbi:hypothetical protein PR202_gn00262 [Eleusine coracana subsp. coracana]|uniref:Uncharacterized protein n=1 Tax=Eleusine coracana subsp. coracana TaxID=191504 RepID=A0AAV5G137_ELECO|nr:hypothetical protein PR202_gn00157 [Eleusine coracana subsp. coracana]GJN40949.1 hypothetical protein PR202_gn00262 [Eleusine coracana subsp. coracana]